MVCSSCAAPNDPLTDFCVECGAPIGTFTNYDPLKHIYAQGWAYRKAVSSRYIKPIVLVGIWLIFGPMVLFIGIAVPQRLFDYWSPAEADTGGVLSFLMTGGIWLLYAAILWRVTRNYWKRRCFVPGSCSECGYNLTGLTEYRCPECAAHVEPEDHVIELALPGGSLPSEDINDLNADRELVVPLSGLRYLTVVAAAIIATLIGPRLLPVKADEFWAILIVYLVVVLIPLEIHGVRRFLLSGMKSGLLHMTGIVLNTIHSAMLIVALVALTAAS